MLKYTEETELIINTVFYMRYYENDVFLNYALCENHLYIGYIEAKEKNQGKGTVVIDDFLKEFHDTYDIVIMALNDVVKWWGKFGFIETGRYDQMAKEMVLYKG